MNPWSARGLNVVSDCADHLDSLAQQMPIKCNESIKSPSNVTRGLMSKWSSSSSPQDKWKWAPDNRLTSATSRNSNSSSVAATLCDHTSTSSSPASLLPDIQTSSDIKDWSGGYVTRPFDFVHFINYFIIILREIDDTRQSAADLCTGFIVIPVPFKSQVVVRKLRQKIVEQNFINFNKANKIVIWSSFRAKNSHNR